VKDKHIAIVWNYLNATQMKAVKEGRKWLGYPDFGRRPTRVV
jgi:hypothetical protein